MSNHYRLALWELGMTPESAPGVVGSDRGLLAIVASTVAGLASGCQRLQAVVGRQGQLLRSISMTALKSLPAWEASEAMNRA